MFLDLGQKGLDLEDFCRVERKISAKHCLRIGCRFTPDIPQLMLPQILPVLLHEQLCSSNDVVAFPRHVLEEKLNTMSVQKANWLRMNIKKHMVFVRGGDERISRTEVVVCQLSELHPVVDACNLVNVPTRRERIYRCVVTQDLYSRENKGQGK